MSEFAQAALDTAKKTGAAYADVRVVAQRRQVIQTKDRMLKSANDTESKGAGIRVLVDGVWGFAATQALTADAAARAAVAAVDIAKANGAIAGAKVVLSKEKWKQDFWQTAMNKDPFRVSLKEKVEALLGVNARALGVKGVKTIQSFLYLVREDKEFTNSEGAAIEQSITRVWPGYDITAVDAKSGAFDSRSCDVAPMQKGYEHVENSGFIRDVEMYAEEAVAKVRAPEAVPGTMDLILHPANLWLTIHETFGHATELDRALGYEANFAGTSFATLDKWNQLRAASGIVTIVGDRTQPGGLASVGYDDEGVETTEFPIIKDGLLVGYQTVREQAHYLKQEHSMACAAAQNWNYFPFQRMCNVSLKPQPKGPLLEEMIAGTDNGIYIVGDGSWSIDHQRYNFQFTGGTFWEIKKGKKTRRLRNVAYQSNTIDFWNSCVTVGNPAEYMLGGSFYCGKGQPPQSHAVSHGCPPAKFTKVNILNTGGKA